MENKRTVVILDDQFEWIDPSGNAINDKRVFQTSDGGHVQLAERVEKAAVALLKRGFSVEFCSADSRRDLTDDVYGVMGHLSALERNKGKRTNAPLWNSVAECLGTEKSFPLKTLIYTGGSVDITEGTLYKGAILYKGTHGITSGLNIGCYTGGEEDVSDIVRYFCLPHNPWEGKEGYIMRESKRVYYERFKEVFSRERAAAWREDADKFTLATRTLLPFEERTVKKLLEQAGHTLEDTRIERIRGSTCLCCPTSLIVDLSLKGETKKYQAGFGYNNQKKLHTGEMMVGGNCTYDDLVSYPGISVYATLSKEGDEYFRKPE